MGLSQAKVMMMKIKEKFAEFDKEDEFQLVDSKHPLDLYVGLDAKRRKTLLLKSEKTLHWLPKTHAIDTSLHSSKNAFYQGIHLDNQNLETLFYHVCEDLFLVSKETMNELEAIRLYEKRYHQWKSLFRLTSPQQLSESRVQGLIAELLFIRHYLLENYDPLMIIESWTGVEQTKKDFSFEDLWFEVKSYRSGKKKVRITSIEQLDSSRVGNLVTVELERLSESYHGYTLNKIVEEILTRLPENVVESFVSKLGRIGYAFEEEYNRIVFDFKKMTFYEVRECFPRIHESDLANGIEKVQYDISFHVIEEYKINTIKP